MHRALDAVRLIDHFSIRDSVRKEGIQMAEFGRTLMMDAEGSTFLRQAERELEPRCAHFEIATDLEGVRGKLKGGPPYDIVLLDYTLILVGSRDIGSIEPQSLPVWKDKFDEAGRLKLLVEMKQGWPEATIVLMIDYPFEASKPDVTELGAHGYINKNWHWSRIMERLAQICL